MTAASHAATSESRAEMTRLGLVVLLACIASAASKGDWTCSKGEIERKAGYLCCNSYWEKKLRTALEDMEEGEAQDAAEAVRSELEELEGGYWQAIMGFGRLAWANYRVREYHCRVSGSDGRVAFVWKLKAEEVEDLRLFERKEQ